MSAYEAVQAGGGLSFCAGAICILILFCIRKQLSPRMQGAMRVVGVGGILVSFALQASVLALQAVAFV